MKLNWQPYIGKTVSITMFENYGIVSDPKTGSPAYEIVFKTGLLVGAYDDGLVLETTRGKDRVQVFVASNAIKCVEISGL